ncbi:TonB-dependent receptor [Pseudomonas stutzeri]|uniref:TonB-dependent receptor plug domain-containing protein n=1 Tax=Stutzerimonas stutzeri TaxID=316 RepID=UPI00210C381E|nr:TonB-dependent receptor [Stutzerimonas stutzeri]MCQ4313235.1 TonB-dependent receptor [Stutzerimonas stutzeri]
MIAPFALWAAHADAAQSARLPDLSIEALAEMDVTSASRRPEPLSGTAAAIFVITVEDIRRSGATSIPEALRLVPGLHVARIDSRRWAISSRGFNGEFANKLLVMIDGRSVYTPVHAGVNWDSQDVLLADIERIEVIRGPGAAQWGANAVNGVINIITKSSHDTHGGIASLTMGNELQTSAVRWGDALGETGSYRAYAKQLRRDDSPRATGDAGDEWSQERVGFRSDWAPQANAFTLQGDLYQGEVGRLFPVVSSPTPPYNQPKLIESDTRGGNVLGRWTNTQSADSETSLQTYFDWYQARPLQIEEEVYTFDLDFQHHLRLNDTHQLVWGGGYRHIRDSFAQSYTISFDPDRQTSDIFSAFAQDTMALTDTLAFTLGAKVEHNDYTGFEFQPSAQLSWTPNEQNTLWGSVSRAVHTPSRADNDVRVQVISPTAPIRVVISGSDSVDAEEVTAYELGYRVSPTAGLFFDLTLFVNDYRELLGTRTGMPYVGDDGRLVVPAIFANGVDGRAWGTELAARWQVLPAWRLDLAYSSLKIDLDAAPEVAGSDASENAAPQQQFSLFSRYDLGEHWNLDAVVRHVDRLEASGLSAYTELDAHVAWSPVPEWSLSLVGQNLLDAQHPEFVDIGAEVERALYVRATHRF